MDGQVLLNRYETSAANPATWNGFMKEFHPEKIGVVNLDEMTGDKFATPKFGEKPDGAFLAIKNDEGKILVFPTMPLKVDQKSIEDLKKAFLISDNREKPHSQPIFRGEEEKEQKPKSERVPTFHVKRVAILDKEEEGNALRLAQRGELFIY